MAISKIVYKSSPNATPVTWMDATPSTATADKVFAGYTAMLADGVVTTGTGTGGGGGSGGSIYQDENGYIVLSPNGGSSEVEKKAVNFYDYDGTRLYSYTAAEAQALEALPSNPTHDGLTAQGWNWTLAQIKSQLTNLGGVISVGQNYVTSDGKTYIDIELDDPNYLHPYFTASVNGTIVVDWGDNSSTTTMTGSADSTNHYANHTYSSTGKYTITITVSSGHFTFRSGGYAGVLQTASTTTKRNSLTYSSKIKAIRIGSNALINQYAFWSCTNLETITAPSTLTTLGTYIFRRNTSLKHFVVPSGITEIPLSMFDQCASMKAISIPSSVTTFGEGAFINSYNLEDITFPASVTSVGKNLINNCSKIVECILPSSIQTIPSGFMYAPYSLKHLTLPSSLTTVETQAFYYLYSLETLTIPANVTSIATKAFYGMYSLVELHFLGTTPPTLADANAFTNIQTFCTIYVPAGYLSAYTSAQYYPSSATYTYVEE